MGPIMIKYMGTKGVFQYAGLVIMLSGNETADTGINVYGRHS